MSEEPLVACGSCGNRVHEPQSRTCPHCLQPLDARRFGSERDLATFQEDRRSHGGHVEPVHAEPKRILPTLLAGAGALMLTGGALILFFGIRGGGAGFFSALSDAMIPLFMGAAMVGAGLKAGGWIT